MTEPSTEPYYKVRRRTIVLVAVSGIAVLAVLAGVYGMGRLRSNPAAAACGPAVEIDRGVDVRHDGIGIRPEASAPHFVAHDTLYMKVAPRPCRR